ncbi:MAG: NADPH-dependent 7-cyano-7-deazaguanine reductase QueF [Gammaproteobacteria bacterium]|nr:NADPH-dependent 7-cyano-7-deazaguanine reductase QueF [Gammaproteobacteria bacterium]
MQRPSEPSKDLQTFENPSTGNDYTIKITVPEFTCLCPLTGQPDFANFVIEYVPDQACVELKSLKMYFWSFRDEGGFHEKLTNEILAKLVAATEPKFMRITANWNVRGGIYTSVVAEHRADGWQAPAKVELP